MKIASLNLLAFVGLFSACTLANPDGFLSINCGASNNDTDGEFEWITDSLFIKFRNTSIMSPFSSNNRAYQYQSVAYFTNMEANKYCYLLPVRPHIQYLVRVRFVWKGFENLRLASVFNLYIEGINWGKVELANFPNSLYVYYEIILTPKRDSMSLCLARNSETQESYYVFISTIELRPLQSQMYSTYTDFNYSALKRFSRINFGSFDEIKFPQDQYDRIWQTFQVPLTTNISTNDSSFRSVKNQQPESVLKTAITSQVGEELLISKWFNVVPGIYYFALYLCNINKTSVSGNNTFQVFIGNVQIAETEVPEYMYCLSPESRLQLSTTDSIDIRIGPQEGSEMRPFINAAEAYQILNITNMTQAGDGLLYLHEGCSPPIIHRDVKCSNILLDKRMFAKITDFGLSKLLDNAKSYITTNVKGTLGYLDPEYFGKSSLNEKSDVYSFGVVLLEIISGVPPKEGLVELAKELLSCGRLADLVDSSLGGRYSVESARKVANIAYACVEAKSINRPTMNIVVKELAEAKALLFDDSGESANVASSNVLDEMPEAR